MSSLGATWKLEWQQPDRIRERLLSRRMILPSGCWVPKGAGVTYTYIRVGGQKVGTHIVALWVWKGIPPSHSRLHVAMHTCDRPPCFNPDHVEAGTQVENVWDAIIKGQRPLAGARVACRQGHLFTEQNTYWYKGNQRCRECHRQIEQNRRLVNHAKAKGWL